MVADQQLVASRDVPGDRQHEAKGHIRNRLASRLRRGIGDDNSRVGRGADIYRLITACSQRYDLEPAHLLK